MNQQKLSSTIITLNEEENLPRCLDSIKELADEIVVVDSGSTDQTVKIARKYGAKVYTREFDNYGAQKNFAATKATGDWTLSLDADEEIEPELRKEIKKAIQSNKFEAYSIPRKNIIFKKFIRFTRWQPELDRHVWLWQKGKGKWQDTIHEEMVIDGRVGKLKNAKIHHQHETVKEFWAMMNRYSNFEAEARCKKGIKFSLFKLLLDPLYNFLVRFFYRLGFLDGIHGFILSYLMAVYHFMIWVKVWERQKT